MLTLKIHTHMPKVQDWSRIKLEIHELFLVPLLIKVFLPRKSTEITISIYHLGIISENFTGFVHISIAFSDHTYIIVAN